jgi:hypothetical protein
MKFVLTSDLHQRIAKWNDLVPAVETERPRFVLIAGDLLPKGEFKEQKAFFAQMRWSTNSITSVWKLPPGSRSPTSGTAFSDRKHWRRLGWCGNSRDIGCIGNRAGLDFWPMTQMNLIRSSPPLGPGRPLAQTVVLIGKIAAAGVSVITESRF